MPKQKNYRTETNSRSGLRKPSRGDRNLQFLRRHHTLTTAVFTTTALSISMLAGISNESVPFGASLAVVSLPFAISVNMALQADISNLSIEIRHQVRLLNLKALGFTALGIFVAFLQVFYNASQFKSSEGIYLAIIALAGVGAWPHAIECLYIVRRHLRHDRRRASVPQRRLRRTSAATFSPHRSRPRRFRQTL